MERQVIAVSGSKGQLGSELAVLAPANPQFQFVFTDRQELDITSQEDVERFFKAQKPALFVNCAAYTAVDKAESDREAAMKVNGEAPGIIARLCKKAGASLIHISTDYVFDGRGKAPYRPDDTTSPVNYYGLTKLAGEEAVRREAPESVIIRTSWVYSRFGNNFVKTMLRLMASRPSISVVSDQVGCPTYAAGLARAIIGIAEQMPGKELHYGTYHYSDFCPAGSISWFEFAVAIRDLAGLSCAVEPIPTQAYPTPAARPHYSVMDTSSIEADFGIARQDWRDQLSACLDLIPKQ